MINIRRFNEGKDINSLEHDVINAFAYISDDNKVDIAIKLSEVIVDIKTIIPSSTTYTNIDEYVTNHDKWNETLLDIGVIIKQLTTDKDYIGFNSVINTVGNIRLSFFIKSNTLFKVEANSIVISRFNLTDCLKEYINVVIKAYPVYYADKQSTELVLNSGTYDEQGQPQPITPINQREIYNILKERFKDLTNGKDIVKIQEPNNYNVNNIRIDFKIHKRSGNSMKGIKLQNII